MAHEFYVTITGTKQGAFKGESIREKHSSKLSGLSYSHSIQSPRDVATGQASGKRQHGAVQITKEWGAATPQIFQALVSNEVLKDVLFEFVQTTPDGMEQVYYTVKLINATVSAVSYTTGGGESAESAKTTATHDTHELEKVSFTYQRIEVEHKAGKTSAVDDWRQ
ncbi:MAG TPA: type VI secretion system tube protein TssD [Polyangiaceae bacterium]|nr:type VI secretion system tube protein TssD [Polyangiaceae bacterium]